MKRHPAAHAVVAVLIVAILAGEVWWLAPHFAEAGRALARPQWAWLAIAVVAEMVSMITFARLQRTMLTAGGVCVPFHRAVVLTFAANVMSVTLPAGPAVSTTYTYKHMRQWGADAPLVTFSLVASGILSTITLVIIGVLGGALAGRQPNPVILTVEIAAVIAIALALRRLAHRPDLVLKLSTVTLHAYNKVRRRPRDTDIERLDAFLEELAVIHPRGRDWGRGLLFSALNWTADFVCLFAACRAIGAGGLTLGVALIAYAAGMAASSIPLLPGGLGIVDGAMILALSQGGLSGGHATAGVAVYRLISFFLVALIGAGAWLLVRQADARLAVQARAVAAACTSSWQAIRARTWPGPVAVPPPAGPEGDNGRHGER
jgi:putative heme transporter